MKKKGFTLIELLAVILILAIIAVIVTPIISKIIDEAKTQADKRSAEKFIRAAQTFYVESQVDEYKRSFLGSNIIDKLDLENTDAKGTVVAYSDGTTEMAIKIGTKCFTKTTTQDIKDIQVSKDLENCVVHSSNIRISNINSGDSSIVITMDNSSDPSITITTCKYGVERGNLSLDNFTITISLGMRTGFIILATCWPLLSMISQTSLTGFLTRNLNVTSSTLSLLISCGTT